MGEKIGPGTATRSGSFGYEVREIPHSDLMMRWADDGSPATFYLQGEEECCRDEYSGVRTFKRREITVTPKFMQWIPLNSVISFGENYTFVVKDAPNKSVRESFPDSVFVKRIPYNDLTEGNGKKIEGYTSIRRKLEEEGKFHMIFARDIGNIPITDRVRKDFQKTGCEL